MVVNILIEDCFLNNASFDQIEHFSFNASAKKSILSRNSSTSLMGNCSASFNAGFNESQYREMDMNSMCFFKRNTRFSSSSLLISDFMASSLEYFCNSFNATSGETSSGESLRITVLVMDSFLKNENKMLVSTTSFN